jgi:hypothetical protein
MPLSVPLQKKRKRRFEVQIVAENRADPGKRAGSRMETRIRKLPSLPEQIHPKQTNFLICRFEPGGTSSVRPAERCDGRSNAQLAGWSSAGGGETEGLEERTRSTHQRPGRGGSGGAEPLEEREETPASTSAGGGAVAEAVERERQSRSEGEIREFRGGGVGVYSTVVGR